MAIPDQQLSKSQKIAAGFILIFSMLSSITLLVAYWPNKIEGNKNIYYCNQPFNVTLIDSTCPCKSAPIIQKKDIARTTATTKEAGTKSAADSIGNPIAKNIKATDTVNKKRSENTIDPELNTKPKEQSCRYHKIHLNALLLILVAISGFLGNIIYVAKSFTAYIGLGTFNDRWLLWYWVKPFIAAGLALTVYLAFNNSPENTPGPINLNGIVAIAIITGLFTDQAILKLKDVFDVIIKPDPDTTLKKSKTSVNMTSIKPEKISLTGVNEIVIPGENIEKSRIDVVLNGKVIENFTVTENTIVFKYQESDPAVKEFKIEILDKNGQQLGVKILKP